MKFPCLGRHFLDDEIATANPPFSGFRNSMELFLIWSYVTGSRKSKMAIVKPEVLISRLVDDKIAMPFQRLTPPFFGSRNAMALFRISPDVNGSRKSNMAVDKPEIPQIIYLSL